jgi:hypothetical protein
MPRRDRDTHGPWRYTEPLASSCLARSRSGPPRRARSGWSCCPGRPSRTRDSGAGASGLGVHEAVLRGGLRHEPLAQQRGAAAALRAVAHAGQRRRQQLAQSVTRGQCVRQRRRAGRGGPVACREPASAHVRPGVSMRTGCHRHTPTVCTWLTDTCISGSGRVSWGALLMAVLPLEADKGKAAGPERTYLAPAGSRWASLRPSAHAAEQPAARRARAEARSPAATPRP